jgi:uncharacterized membrane protein
MNNPNTPLPLTDNYQPTPGEFNTAMVHLFRAEVHRANIWRNRLDVTTNWAMVATGASITIAFGESSAHHSVILLNTLLITLFLMIEGRRYRYYELWSHRVRLLERNYFAAMLTPNHPTDASWSEALANSLRNPVYPISVWEAVGRRYRRNYVWIYLVLGLAWIGKITLYPDGVNSWVDIVERAAIGDIAGGVVLAAGTIFNSTLLLLGLVTWNLRRATGEVFQN